MDEEGSPVREAAFSNGPRDTRVLAAVCSEPAQCRAVAQARHFRGTESLSVSPEYPHRSKGLARRRALFALACVKRLLAFSDSSHRWCQQEPGDSRTLRLRPRLGHFSRSQSGRAQLRGPSLLPKQSSSGLRSAPAALGEMPPDRQTLPRQRQDLWSDRRRQNLGGGSPLSPFPFPCPSLARLWLSGFGSWRCRRARK